MARKEVTTDDIKLDEPAIDLDKGEDAIQQIEVPVCSDLSKLSEQESFMNERLEVFFAEPPSENESPLVEVTVNGRYLCYPRGRSGLVPRYAVEVIARSKLMRVSTEKRIMSDQTESVVPVTRTSSVYPFTVTRDPSGSKGAAWLRNILSQPL